MRDPRFESWSGKKHAFPSPVKYFVSSDGSILGLLEVKGLHVLLVSGMVQKNSETNLLKQRELSQSDLFIKENHYLDYYTKPPMIDQMPISIENFFLFLPQHVYVK